MGWIEQEFRKRVHSGRGQKESPDGTRLEVLVSRKWEELIHGLEQDVEGYRRLGGDAEFRRNSDSQCYIANPVAGISATVSSEISAHTVQYSYAAEEKTTPVPEGGFFSVRKSHFGAAELYSADQRISLEQARRMVLEPLLFPSQPSYLMRESA